MTIKFIKYWLPPVAWAGVIFYLSGVSGLASDMSVFWDVFWRKLFHAGEFGLMNLLLWRALYYGNSRAQLGEGVGFRKAFFWSLFLTILYAVSDELHQAFVPLRQCRWQDVAQDSLGVLLTSIALYGIFGRRGKH